MVLALDNHHVQKAKACQEMIMYERSDSNSTNNAIDQKYQVVLQQFIKSINVNNQTQVVTKDNVDTLNDIESVAKTEVSQLSMAKQVPLMLPKEHLEMI